MDAGTEAMSSTMASQPLLLATFVLTAGSLHDFKHAVDDVGANVFVIYRRERLERVQDVEGSQLPHAAGVCTHIALCNNCCWAAMHVLSWTEGSLDVREELAEDVRVRQVAEVVIGW